MPIVTAANVAADNIERLEGRLLATVAAEGIVGKPTVPPAADIWAPIFGLISVSALPLVANKVLALVL